MPKTKPAKYVIVLWEMLPDKVDLYLIPRAKLSKDDIQTLHKCHGNYVNGGNHNTHNGKHTTEEIDRALAFTVEAFADPAANWINDEYLKNAAKQLDISTKKLKQIIGCWFPYKIDSLKPKILPRARLFQTGFLM